MELDIVHSRSMHWTGGVVIDSLSVVLLLMILCVYQTPPLHVLTSVCGKVTSSLAAKIGERLRFSFN